MYFSVSFLTQKTVLLVAPQEMTDYMDKPVSVSIHHKTGVQKDGRIVASILDVTVDAGAFCPFAEQISNARIGKNCSIGFSPNPPSDGDHGMYYAADGIIIIRKNAIIPDGSNF